MLQTYHELEQNVRLFANTPQALEDTHSWV